MVDYHTVYVNDPEWLQPFEWPLALYKLGGGGSSKTVNPKGTESVLLHNNYGGEGRGVVPHLTYEGFIPTERKKMFRAVAADQRKVNLQKQQYSGKTHKHVPKNKIRIIT
jgi:hypothetical protein